jgi:hypothetical protein
MNRTSLSKSGRGLVLVGGVTIMGISLAMAQLAAQQRAPGQDPNRSTERRTVQPQEEQRVAPERPAERRLPANGEQPAEARDQTGREDRTSADRTRADGRESTDARRGQQGRSEQGRSRGPWLGVFLQEASEQDASNTDRGAAVTHIFPASPAARAGFRSGDVITAVNGQQVAGPEQLVEAIEQLDADKKTEFTVLRRDQQMKLSATLAGRDPFMSSGFRNLEPGQEEQWAEDHDHDEFYDIPEHAMELEAHRRLAEQHERIENLIQQLRTEVQALREELKTRR